MLRESSIVFGYNLDIAAIADRNVDAGPPGSTAILNLVDALFSGTDTSETRQATMDAVGEAGFVDVCAVYGNFSMMNRVAEGTGIPLSGAGIAREIEIVETLGLRPMMKTH